MPQYELDDVGPDHFSGRTRGRTPEEAVRRTLDLAEAVEVTVDEEADLRGWQTVYIDGDSAGRIRPHQRMQFRRD